MAEYLFVCGTLRPGLRPPAVADLARRLRPVGPASVCGRLYDLGEYPGAVLGGASDGMIIGELLELPEDEAVLAALDAYEGIDPTDPDGGLFVRTRCDAALPDGRRVESWIYAYNRDPGPAPLVEGGDYLTAKTSHNRRLD